MKTAFNEGPLVFGSLTLIAVYRCTCGKVTAPAEQPNGNAAIVHADPRCDRFEALKNQQEAFEYFRNLEPVPLIEGLELVGNTSP